MDAGNRAVLENGPGFHPLPDEDALKRKLPAAWAADAARFLTLELRDEEALEKALQSNFELLKAEEQRRNQQFMRRGRAIKLMVTLLTLGLAAFVAITSLRLLLNHSAVYTGSSKRKPSGSVEGFFEV